MGEDVVIVVFSSCFLLLNLKAVVPDICGVLFVLFLVSSVFMFLFVFNSIFLRIFLGG